MDEDARARSAHTVHVHLAQPPQLSDEFRHVYARPPAVNLGGYSRVIIATRIRPTVVARAARRILFPVASLAPTLWVNVLARDPKSLRPRHDDLQ